MSIKLVASIIAATLVLAGCRVQSVQGTIVQTQPVAVAKPKRVQIEGAWEILDRGRVFRRIEIRRVRGGIRITGLRRDYIAERVAPRVFQDNLGRTYQFFSDVEGRFDAPDDGQRFRLRRS